MSEDANNPLTEFEILADGTLVPVRYKPGAPGVATPTEETVKVWKLGMAEMPMLGNAMGNEAREIAVVCRRDEKWVLSLEDDSFEKLIEEGRRLNFTRFTRYWKRQSDLLRAMGQGAAMDNAVARAVDKVLQQQADGLRP